MKKLRISVLNLLLLIQFHVLLLLSLQQQLPHLRLPIVTTTRASHYFFLLCIKYKHDFKFATTAKETEIHNRRCISEAMIRPK